MALREQDRLILNEWHPQAFAALKAWAGRDRRIALHWRDALEALVALTPPHIRRGLVLVDPSYEVKTEYTDVPKAVAKAHSKWSKGIFAVWYAVLPEGRHKEMLDAFAALPDWRPQIAEQALKLKADLAALAQWDQDASAAIVAALRGFEGQEGDAGSWKKLYGLIDKQRFSSKCVTASHARAPTAATLALAVGHENSQNQHGRGDHKGRDGCPDGDSKHLRR